MTKFNVVGLGNAIVDVLAKVEDSFITENNLIKGGMSLIDEAQAEDIYSKMPPAIEASGGSAANTLAGIAALGGACAFIGKVKDDHLGKIFSHDIKAIGVHYETAPATGGASTARCLISVTEDAERTMATYLGATRVIAESDIDENVIKSAKVLYLEGYLWDEEHAKKAMRRAITVAKDNDVKTSLSLSDPFCVDRHRADFLELIESGVDILFANEDEIKSLFQTNDIEEALQKIAKICSIAAITLGSKGSCIVANNEQTKISAPSNLNVIDTTGAGDLYASGFLYGYTTGENMAECGRLATDSASEVIQQMGARPSLPKKNAQAL